MGKHMQILWASAGHNILILRKAECNTVIFVCFTRSQLYSKLKIFNTIWIYLKFVLVVMKFSSLKLNMNLKS